MKKPWIWLAGILICSAIACGAPIQDRPEPTLLPTLIPAPGDLSPTPPPTSTAVILPPSSQESEIEDNQRKLWAVEAVSDLMYSETDMVLGSPDVDMCGDAFAAWTNLNPETSPSEYFLQLTYPYRLSMTEVNVVIGGNPGGRMRVEVLDSSSGLGREIFNGNADTDGACPGIFTIPVSENLSVDTVILSFSNADQPIQIDAVELVGNLTGFIDLPVFWRIPIPADSLSDADSQYPGGIAVDPLENTLFLANGRNGLYRYDVEGNLLKTYSVPSEANLRDVAADHFGMLVVTDSVYQWYISMLYDGTQVIAGGEDFAWNYPKAVAISPYDGNVYLLDESEETSRIRVYTSDTGDWVRDIYLEPRGIDGYKGLAFDPNAYLYISDQIEGGLLRIEPMTGAILDTIGYLELSSSSVSDLAIDDHGNFYVLMSTSPDDSAVYVLNPQGTLIRRFGHLNYDGSDWSEGIFQMPVSIAVTGDGRFVFICENGFLTAYRWEEQ